MGLEPGREYAFGIHQYGTVLGGCENVGEAFLPDRLGSLEANDAGFGRYRQREQPGVRLYGPQSIVGRSCVLYSSDWPSSDILACGVVMHAEFKHM